MALLQAVIINTMLRPSQQNYLPSPKGVHRHPPQLTHPLLELTHPLPQLHRIGNQQQHFKMLVNSFRTQRQPDNHHPLQNKSSLHTPARAESTPRGRNQEGDFALAHRPRHLLPNFHGELSRVGHLPRQPGFSRVVVPQCNRSSSNPEELRRLSPAKGQSVRKGGGGARRGEDCGCSSPQQFEVESVNSFIFSSHLQSVRGPSAGSSPEEIFAFFESLYQLGQFPLPKEPVVKRYRQCLYYGERPNKGTRSLYLGMVWHFTGSLYYGQFREGKKHGTGLEIEVEQGAVWKGRFDKGRRAGYFHVDTPVFKYYGAVVGEHFHGEGHLVTARSQYKGSFQQGQKEGHGWEKFNNKSEYKGEYFDDKFDGHGQLKAPDYYYEGLFKKGKPDGHGFERTPYFEYLGDFVMGVKQGRGRIKTAGGTTLECAFLGGLAVDRQVLAASPSPGSRRVLGLNGQQVGESSCDFR